MKGTIKRWITGRGYGFIESDEGEEDVFLHNSEVQGVFPLQEGQRVEFEVEETDKGLRAVNVTVAE